MENEIAEKKSTKMFCWRKGSILFPNRISNVFSLENSPFQSLQITKNTSTTGRVFSTEWKHKTQQLNFSTISSCIDERLGNVSNIFEMMKGSLKTELNSWLRIPNIFQFKHNFLHSFWPNQFVLSTSTKRVVSDFFPAVSFFLFFCCGFCVQFTCKNKQINRMKKTYNSDTINFIWNCEWGHDI